MRQLYLIQTFQRSGSHAIYNWLFSQFNEPVLFFNNAKAYEDPAIEMRNPDWNLKNTVDLRPYWKEPYRRKEIQQMTNKRIIIGFEDKPLGCTIPPSSYSWIKPDEIWKLMILRDVYNWITSRWAKGMDISPQKINQWKTYARSTMGYEFISFNGWFKSKEYRSRVLHNLDIKQIHDNINFVPAAGGGSSFDKRRYQNNGSQMAVLERWKEFYDENIEKLIKHDKELRQLNLDLFNMEFPW